MAVIRRAEGASRRQLHERCKQVAPVASVTGWVANVADVTQDPVGGGDPTAEAVIEIHLGPSSADGDRRDVAAVLDHLAGIGAPCEVYAVEERLMWDRHGEWPIGAAATGFNRVALVPRLESISHEQFAAHWTDRHGPIAHRHHPGIARYVQNIVQECLTPGAPEWDGIAELHFVRTSDFTDRMYDSPEGKAIVREDVRRFIDPSRGERFLFGRWTILRDSIPRSTDNAR